MELANNIAKRHNLYGRTYPALIFVIRMGYRYGFNSEIQFYFNSSTSSKISAGLNSQTLIDK